MKIGLGRVGYPAVTSSATRGSAFKTTFTRRRRLTGPRELVRAPSPVTWHVFALRRTGR